MNRTKYATVCAICYREFESTESMRVAWKVASSHVWERHPETRELEDES